MENQSRIDPTRETAGAIYRDAQINGEQGVVIGDVNHEIKKDLVKDINEAIEMGEKEMNGKPFYLAIYEKYDLMMKRGLVRIRKITKYRPYPEQDTMVFHAGTKNDGGRLVTNGGRVLGVASLGRSLEAAATKAYNAVIKIEFDHMFFRRDIASKILKEKPVYGRH